MNRKDYEKPMTRIVEIRQRVMLLTGSGVGGRNPYDPTDDNPFGN